MKHWQTALSIFAALFASVALAEDFKTIEGKEYKNVRVSRVEPDGIVITFSGGIVKLPFTELPPEAQKKYGYDSSAAAAYSAEEYQKQSVLAQQRKADEQRRLEEREKYWSEHSVPQQQQPKQPKSSSASAVHGSSLDRPAYDQSTTAVFLVSQYATNQLNAEKLYTGRTFKISGTIKSIDLSDGEVVVELFVPGYWVGKTWFMECIFNDSRGLEQYRAGNSIGFIGTVAGLNRYTLMVKDCQLLR
jgi:hypothetical protein